MVRALGVRQKMKRLLLLVTLILAVDTYGQINPTVSERFSRWLTPEICATSDPDALYIRHLEADGASWDSEQARDGFHQAYAVVLAARTDQRHPEAARFRSPLLDAFKHTFEFIRTANGNTSTAHQMSRLPAEVEWMISRGFESKFDNGVSGEYTFDDIRQLARIYQRSQSRFTIGTDLSDLEARILEPALGHLKAAEESMSKAAVAYFRAKLVSMIAKYIGR